MLRHPPRSTLSSSSAASDVYKRQGRETKVKTLVEKAEILHHIDDIKDSRTQFILFSRYMEALVAYRKFIGGHDE